MAADPNPTDIEALRLLHNLRGRARQERAQLIEWLLARGFNAEQIRSEFGPMLLPDHRVMGDDGTRWSHRDKYRSPAA